MRKKALLLSVLLSLSLISAFLAATLFHSERVYAVPSESNDDWPMFLHDPNHTGYITSLGPTSNNTLWSYIISNDCYSSPAISNSLIYVGTTNYVYCFNETTGTYKWRAYTGWSSHRSSPAVAYGRLYIGGGPRIFCLNSSTGSQIWNYTTGDDILYSSPVIASDRIYIGSKDKKVYCLNATTGKKLWDYTTGGYVYSSPAVVSGYLYVELFDGFHQYYLYCLNALTGNAIWNSSIRAHDWHEGDSSPVVAYGCVFTASDFGVSCFNATTGTLKWLELGLDVTTNIIAPAIANGRIYINGQTRSSLYCLNSTNGNLLWSRYLGDIAYWSPTIASGFVYIATAGSNAKARVYCFNSTTGEIVWDFTSAISDHFYSLVIANGRAYVCTSMGTVYCFGNNLGNTLNFVTKDASGNVLPSCNVTVAGVGSAISDTNGWVTFDGVAPGTYVVTTRWQGNTVNQITITAPMLKISTDIKCRIYTLSLAFTDSSGDYSVVPSQVTVLCPNGTTKTLTVYSGLRAQNGTWVVNRVICGGLDVVPATNPSITVTSNTVWAINCRLYTSVTIRLSTTSALMGFKVIIRGNLTCNEVALSGLKVLLEYSVTGGKTWESLTTVTTGADGSYLAEWMPSATGEYLARASWAGNDTYPMSNCMVNMVVLPAQEKYVFSFLSNSTISALAFNSTSRELSFSVTGPSGTTGYVNVYIAKSLIGNILDVKVYLDGNQLDYTATPTDDSWLLRFTYQHSTHKVTINLGTMSVPFIKTIIGEALIYGVPVAATIVLIAFLVLKKKHRI